MKADTTKIENMLDRKWQYKCSTDKNDAIALYMLDCKRIRLAVYMFELNKLQFLTFLMALTLIKKIQLRSNLIVLQTQG